MISHSMLVGLFKKGVRFLKNINVITPPTVRVSYIILTITLTVILISSPVMTVFSPSLFPPMALKVGLTSASATTENNDDDDNEGGGGEESSTTDAMTDEEEEEVDDNGGSGDVQQEDNTEQEQQPPSSSTQEQEDDDEEGGGQQFATVVGEICDDLEDNDGDGLIDLADVEDCAPPVTQGTVTAPTTPPPSVANTTATNSTANTLTAAGITTSPPPQQQQDSPYIVEVCDNRIDDDGDGLADLDDFEGCAPPSTSSNTRYMTPSGNIVDVTGCTSFEEMGIEPGSPSPGDPPNLVYFDCDNITWGLIPLDSTTTTSTDSGTGTGG